MNERRARTYGGIRVGHFFGESGDVRTNLMAAELSDLEDLVGDSRADTTLVIGAELEPLTVALHYLSRARVTAGVGGFGSWHDPFGDRITTTVAADLDLPMFEATSSDPAILESVVNDSFGASSLDLVVDMGTSSLARSAAFWSLLPRLSSGAKYLLRRSTPDDHIHMSALKELAPPDIVAGMTGMASYEVAALSFEASLSLADADSPISRVRLGRSWVTIELAPSN